MSGIPHIRLAAATAHEEKAIAEEISRACTEVGFFVVDQHGVDPNIFDRAFESSLEFFHRPTDEKDALPIRTSNLRGDNDYTPYGYTALLGENGYAYAGKPGMPADYVEKFSVGRLILDDTEELPFPEGDHGVELRAAMKAHFVACETVANRITELLSIALELPRDFFAQRTDRSNDSLRSLFYPGRQPDFANDQGCAEHTDGSLITLLSQDGPGLQLCNQSGEWLDIQTADRNSFIVNIGDLMARWSNDEYRSTPHRVRLADRPRQSIAFFKLANDDALIECFPKFTRTREARYEPIRYETFSLQKMNALFGRTSEKSNS